MDNQLIETVIATVLGKCDNGELALSPAYRPIFNIDGYKHPVLKVRVGKDGAIEANIVHDLWARISFEPRSRGYVDPEILLAFIKVELSR